MSNLNNFDPKYGSKGISKEAFCFKMRSQTRGKCFWKFFIIAIVVWIVTYAGLAYVSTYKSQLLDEFKKEDMNIKKLQEKISQLVAKGFVRNDAVEVIEPVAQQDDRVEEPKKNDKDKVQEKYQLDDGITEEAKRFIAELNLKNPGENGDAVELPKNLSEDIQKRIKQGFDTFGYNGNTIIQTKNLQFLLLLFVQLLCHQWSV
jgi:hypothetical protein